jgi:inosine-uridine nucleoside N-ribohydrolase
MNWFMNSDTLKIPLIIDTDMAPDDWVAILYMGKRKDIDIKAITISGTGEAHGSKGAENCLRLLNIINKDDIPVAYGNGQPIKYNHHFPKLMRFAVDKRLFIKFPKSEYHPIEESAIQLLKNHIEKSKTNVVILALGPLTNLAEFINKFPPLKEKIEKIYIMGGAVEVEGNISSVSRKIDNPYAEWNIYCDPHAANIVFESGIPIVLVPLDATDQLPVDKAFVKKLKSKDEDEISTLMLKILKRFGSRVEREEVPFWDLVAASVVGRDEIANIRKTKIHVIETENEKSGFTKEDNKNGAEIQYCTSVDKEKYESHFFNTIFADSKEN